MGIDLIYYHKGDYESAELSLEYLAEDNTFIKEAKQVFSKFFYINTNSSSTDNTYKILISVMNQSYYNRAKNYPELLELNGQYLDLVNAYETATEASGKVNDSLYNTCINMFNILSKSGIKSARDIWECLINNFANAVLCETDIRVILQKQHMLYDSKSLNIEGKSNDELIELVDILNRKIKIVWSFVKRFAKFVVCGILYIK